MRRWFRLSSILCAPNKGIHHIQKGGFDGLSDAMKATYLSDTTRRRTEASFR